MTDDDDAQTKAQSEEEEVAEAKKVMAKLEEGDPPEKLEDWPGGKAKYQTYGAADPGEGGYEDGSVTVDGEEVDNPDDYKGEPIPGGPSDPDAPPDPAMIGQDQDDEDDSSGSEDDDSSGEDEDRSSDDSDSDDDDSDDDSDAGERRDED
jgi:hypothetical protein